MLRQTSRTLSRLLLIYALTTCALAQQPAPQNSTRTDEPNVEALRAHVRYLASDELEGRRTGTVGAEKAASYIESEFKRRGLRPGVVRPLVGYFQPFHYVAAVELGKRNAMSFVPRAVMGNPGVVVPPPARDAASIDLRLGEDWSPIAWSANAKVERGEVVYVGYGITAAELNRDDYANIDARGKIVLAFAGTPDGDNPHGQFARFEDLRFKAAAARDHGASALLVISREENFKNERLARLRVDENLAAAGDAGIPVTVVSRQVARRAVEAAALPSVTFEMLEQTADAKPSGATQGATVESGPPNATRKNFSTPLKNVAFSLETEIARRMEPAYNVVGILEGSDPNLKNEAIVIGAHYDHLGLGGAGSLAAREGEVHHGADDNASGVAALVELARIFSASRQRPRRTIVFVAFSGEEEGLIGSSYYVKHPVVPLAQTIAMVNMDMIGRLKDDKLIVGGVGTAAEWRKIVESANTEMNLKVNVNGVPSSQRTPGDVPFVTGSNGAVIATANPKPRFTMTLNEDGYGPSDHSSFYAKQIPVLFIWTGTHEDYHKPTDTADKINYEGLARVTAFVRDVLREVDDAATRPTYTQAKSDTGAGRSMGFKVYLGTIPNYAEGGAGLKLDGVREGSPAERAGLKANDVVVRLAGRDVKNVYDYTYALGEMKAGQEYEVEVVRGGERLKLKITPEIRK
jgi:Zn-dependent M28 family amino/carboxypeptidase